MKQQIEASGCSATTIRSVAKACGVGVGTVYNYFPSKEALVAAYLLNDWNQCIASINAVSASSKSPAPVVRCIYDQLLAYAVRHKAIFHDESASAAFGGSFSPYHALLRSQLAAPMQKFSGSDFSADFIAEALLTWTMAGKAFDDIYSIINKLF